MARWPATSGLQSAMRSVSYVQRVALDFSGSLFPHAICLGDVDNDTVSTCALQMTALGRGERWEVACGARAHWSHHGVRKINLIDSFSP